MKLDLHVHTCLSPCADLLMVPDVVKDFSEKLDALGIADHNSAKNVRAFSRVKEIVVPGLEIQTVEDVHLLCFFTKIENALKVTEIVYEHLPKIRHDHERAGYQLLVNEEGEYTGYEDHPLNMPTDLTLKEVVELVVKNGGFPVYAHAERRFGVLFQLGFFPELEVYVAEVVSEEGKILAEKAGLRVIVASDAHRPEEIGKRYIEINCEGKRIEKIFENILRGEYRLGGVCPWLG